MSSALAKAAQYQAFAAASLGNAETARDKTICGIHLAIAEHFYALAETEISRHKEKAPFPLTEAA
jgi:hypothetical protein